jgi:hypothetical protein
MNSNNQKNLIMKNWISKLAVTAGWMVAAAAAHGALYTFNSTGSASILDYPSSGVGYQFTYNHAGLDQITDVSVTFTTLGGWNGDLYAYLSHGDGLAVLLNRVGASTGDPDGYGTSGFTAITLNSLATTDIHGQQNPTSGAGPYAADGRINYTDTARPNTLSVFDNANPNGAWTIYFADMAALNTATLDSWSVNITAVPEPVNVALGLFGVLFAGVTAARWRLNRKAVRLRLPQTCAQAGLWSLSMSIGVYRC